MIDRSESYIKALEDHLRKNNADWTGPILIERPPAVKEISEFDLAIPCFTLSKSRRQPPHKCAEEVAEKLRQAKELEIEKIEVVRGFVNVRLKAEVLGRTLRARVKEPLGNAKTAFSKEKFVVDFSSPNIAKPFGIGHLRSTNIGAALCRIFNALGAEVVRVNHLGDWGTQFGKMIVAYKKFGSAEFVKGDPVNNLYKLYVEFHQKEEDDPSLLDEAREAFVKLEAGDPEAVELWKWFKDVSYTEFKRIYDRLNVHFDYVTGESFYNKLMEKTIQHLRDKKLLKESDGAQIVDLEEYDMPPCLIKKSDGSTLYATRDLATAEYRLKTFQPTKLVYVVGGEQTLHFRQVYKVLELLGHKAQEICKHVSFGLIRFPEGKMSTRKGNIILLEKVLDEAEKKALQIVQQKNEEKDESRRLSQQEMNDICRKVGLGAVIFFDLHAKRTKDIQFHWDQILNFEGDSGPYLQYTHVRLGALLRKAKDAGFKTSDDTVPLLTTKEERELARELLAFPVVVESAGRAYEPSMISHALLELASVFNRFYMNVRVIKGDKEQLPGRLKLVELTRKTLGVGLGLLGVECPERM